MIFVLPLFIVAGVFLLAVWWFFFRATVRHEGAVRAAKEREADFDRLLQTPGEPLYCLECRTVFPGPLENHGCPDCHVRAFVIPARTHSDPSVISQMPEADARKSEPAKMSRSSISEGEADALQKQQRN